MASASSPTPAQRQVMSFKVKDYNQKQKNLCVEFVKLQNEAGVDCLLLFEASAWSTSALTEMQRIIQSQLGDLKVNVCITHDQGSTRTKAELKVFQQFMSNQTALVQSLIDKQALVAAQRLLNPQYVSTSHAMGRIAAESLANEHRRYIPAVKETSIVQFVDVSPKLYSGTKPIDYSSALDTDQQVHLRQRRFEDLSENEFSITAALLILNPDDYISDAILEKIGSVLDKFGFAMILAPLQPPGRFDFKELSPTARTRISQAERFDVDFYSAADWISNKQTFIRCATFNLYHGVLTARMSKSIHRLVNKDVESCDTQIKKFVSKIVQ